MIKRNKKNTVGKMYSKNRLNGKLDEIGNMSNAFYYYSSSLILFCKNSHGSFFNYHFSPVVISLNIQPKFPVGTF